MSRPKTKRQHRADVMAAVAIELESHIANGSEFLFYWLDEEPYSDRECKWREETVREIVDSLLRRAARLRGAP